MTINFNQSEIETIIELIEAAFMGGFDHEELITSYDKLKAELLEQEGKQ